MNDTILDETAAATAAAEWKSMPDVWNDDVRMNALFAPFRNRDLNPLHYDAKLKFWRETILNFIKEKELLQFDLDFLENCFVRDKRKPKCLEPVVQEMIKEGSLKMRDEILKPKNSGNGIVQNLFSKLVWSPISWSTNYLLKRNTNNNAANILNEPVSSSCDFTSPIKGGGITSPSSNRSPMNPSSSSSVFSNNNNMVFVDLIEKKAYELLKLLQSSVTYRNVDCVVDYEEAAVRLVAANICKSDADLELIMKYLFANNKLIMDATKIENRRLIKFVYNLDGNVEPINEIEVSYQELKSAEKKLEDESSKLVDQIEQTNAKIKEIMQQQNNNSVNKCIALRHLRKRKQIEKSLEHKDAIIANLQSMISNIQQMHTNKLTYEVYNRSLAALKEANKDLNVDNVDDTMFDLQDMMQKTKDVEEALSKPAAAAADDDEQEQLNKELDDLIKEQQQQQQKQSKSKEADAFDNMKSLLESLPDITTTPKTTTTIKKIADDLKS